MDNSNQTCPSVSDVFGIVYKMSAIEFLAMILPWIGVFFDQLYHRSIIANTLGIVFIFGAMVAILIMVVISIVVFLNKNNPARWAFSIILVMTISALISFFIALAAFMIL